MEHRQTEKKLTDVSLLKLILEEKSVQFSSVAQPCLTLCDAMDGNTPGHSVHHQLLKHAQTHVH